MFLGNRKERLKLYKAKKGWVLAKKTAIVLGTTTVIGLSLTVNASANEVDTSTSDSTVVATTNADDKKEVANKDEVPTPTTATSELNNTNEGTSDSTSDTADKTSDVVKDSTSETNSVSSNSVDTSNQPVTNIESAESKSATTSLMATAEPTVTPSSVSTKPTETQPTLTTAQTDNTQVKPVVVQTETPYQTEYVEDKNLDEGQTKLIQPGKNTLVVTTTTYTLLADGSVQANEPAENKTTGQNEIIAVGVKKATGQKDNQTQTKVQNSTKEQLKVTNVTPKAPFEQPKDLKVAQKAKTLPQTGIDETNLGILSLMLTSLVGFVSALVKKKNH